MVDVNLRIRAYRELAGITQQDLGDKVGVTRQTIASWEKGGSTPTLTQAYRLAEVLGIQIDMLLNVDRPPEPAFLFRADDPKALSPELRVLLTRRAADYAAVERILGLTPLVPESRPMDKYEPGEVEAVAQEKRRWLGAGDGPLCHAPSLLEDKGLKIIVHPMPLPVSGFSAFSEELGAVVFVNANQPVERRSFTALHEMAHLVFHRREYQKAPQVKRRNDPREKAAHHFAGAVLLPRDMLERELRGYRNRWIPEPLLVHLKLRYHVSMRAILMRAGELGLILKEQMRNQLGILDRKYGKGREPVALPEPECEEIPRLRRLVFEALLQEKITTSRAAEILGIPMANLLEEWAAWTDGEGQ